MRFQNLALLIYARLNSPLAQEKSTVEVNPIEVIHVSLYLPVYRCILN